MRETLIKVKALERKNLLYRNVFKQRNYDLAYQI